jgi:WD40 repeat protein
MHYHNLAGPLGPDDFPRMMHLKTGLGGIAYWTAISESRKLIFAADSDRIKSFAWGDATSDYEDDPLATHTMDSGAAGGPLAILGESRLIRAGRGFANVWNLDELPTHGEDGEEVIGEEYDTENTWRDDPEDIEVSAGTPAHTRIDFEGGHFKPSEWIAHPGGFAGRMICASDSDTTLQYGMVDMDLNARGKIISRYIGHSGAVSNISTSVGDPHMFATSCTDGYARLWDVRNPLPVLTIDVARYVDARCGGIALAHPDGIPSMFYLSTSWPNRL